MRIEAAERLFTPEQKITRIEVIVADRPEVAGFQGYEYLTNGAAKQEAAFIAGDIESPEMQYPNLTRDKLRGLAYSMEEATASLLPGQKNEKTKSLFDAIEYRQAELFMTQMAADMNNTALGEEARAEARDWYRQANEAIYGLPERDTFAALMQREYVDRHTENQPRATSLKSELQPLVGELEPTNKVLFEPTSEHKARLQALVKERFAELVSHIDIDKQYALAEIKAAIDVTLDKLGATDLGWKSEYKAGSQMIAVSAHQKLVEVGADRKPLMGEEFQMKLVHELGVHVLRSVNGEKAGWLSAAYGQDGYLDFEEALANILGESFTGKFRNQGTKYYIAAGLALGYDRPETDGQPNGRDFRQTYEALWRHLALQQSDQDITEKEIMTAKIDAFKTCIRIFRGTSGKEPGLIFTKDLSYFRGQEQVWSELKDVKTLQELDHYLMGKLDNSLIDHDAIATTIERALRVDAL
jgi:hypothetical protein